jgi:dihydropteroate synthase
LLAYDAGLMKPIHSLVMGVLNVTPDSFSDAGRFYAKGNALAHAEQMVRDGVDIIDIGGESTRPGATAVSMQEEMDRVLPVVEVVKQTLPVRISVDTRKFEIAREAVRLGASIVNDITGGADARLPSLGRGNDVDFLLMHMQGNPQTMQQAPSYPEGVVQHVRQYLTQRVRAFVEAGIPSHRLWIDPGIGFGKTLEHNLQLLRSLKQFQGIGGRVAIGTSRKSFLSKILPDEETPVEAREPGTLASNLWAYTQGVSVFRVHDVASFRRAFKTWEAIEHVSKP